MSPFIREIIEHSGAKIAEICRRHHVRQLELFGSATSGHFDLSRSDVDFLVTFERDYFPGIADAFLGLADDLEAVFNRPVELLTRRSLRNPFLKKSIEQQAVSIYESKSEQAPA
jgi:predicted nucleotidyltransferase